MSSALYQRSFAILRPANYELKLPDTQAHTSIIYDQADRIAGDHMCSKCNIIPVL